LIETGDKRRG